MTPNETESYKRKLRAIISPLAPPCQKLRNPMMVRSWKWRDWSLSSNPSSIIPSSQYGNA